VTLLLDTHAIIWLYTDDPQMSSTARDAIRQADAVFVSFASAWEYGIKRLQRPEEFGPSFDEIRGAMPVSGLGIEFDLHAYAESLPPIHRDPFDRMLIAQALHHELTLVTKDSEISRYPVSTLW
jgi:PIN domain nuclease of toxin-antitoxin system